jgi:signal transduction histidine kinase
LDVLDGLARYLLAVPAAVLASLALRAEALEAREGNAPRITVYLTWAAVGFGIYSLTQLFVPKIDIFPARFLNATTFRAFTNFPIQVVRSIVAVVITISLLRATQIMEKERQVQLLAAQNERLEALERIRVELTKRENMRSELLRHTVRAQEEERARIARELHDETSQVLTAFTLDLATLGKSIPNRSRAKELVDRLQSLSKQMSKSLYGLVHDLRPAQLDDLGLIPALEYLKENSLSKGLEVSITVEGKPRRLDSITETVLFRVAQEALTNTIRHARTDQARISLHYKTQEIILCISDRGVGFNPGESFIPPRGWGLAGIRERVESVSGALHIESAPGKGTTVEVAISLFDILP